MLMEERPRCRWRIEVTGSMKWPHDTLLLWRKNNASSLRVLSERHGGLRLCGKEEKLLCRERMVGED